MSLARLARDTHPKEGRHVFVATKPRPQWAISSRLSAGPGQMCTGWVADEVLSEDAGACPATARQLRWASETRDRKRATWCARDSEEKESPWAFMRNVPVPFLEGGFLGPSPTILGQLQCRCDVSAY